MSGWYIITQQADKISGVIIKFQRIRKSILYLGVKNE